MKEENLPYYDLIDLSDPGPALIDYLHYLSSGLTDLSTLCYEAAAKAGWWTDLDTGELLHRNRGEIYALMHSELSEAMEGMRKSKRDEHLPQFLSEEVELADALIRIFDYAGGYNLRLGEALIAKLQYNAQRADHKPENRRQEGGKKF